MKSSQSVPARVIPLILLEIAVGTVIAVVAFLSFLYLSHEVNETTLPIIDRELSNLLYSYRSPVLTQIMLLFTFLGGNIMLTISSLALFLLLFIKNYRHEASLFGVTFVMGCILNLLLKEIIGRARPDMSPLIHEMYYSFPSGHSMNSLVFYALLAYLTYHFTRSISRTVFVSSLCILLILMIGLSRIYLGVHYPSDIMAGYLAGVTWFITVLVIERTAKYIQRPGKTKSKLR